METEVTKKVAPEITAALKSVEARDKKTPKTMVVLMEVELALGDSSIEHALLDVQEIVNHIDGVGQVRYARIIQPTGELIMRDRRPRPLPAGQD